MSKLDTNHVVNLDLVKDRVNSVIKFGLADVETSDFYLGLYNNGSRVFDKDYIVTLYIVKPNGTFRNIKLEPKEGLKKYYCNLPDTLKNIAGEYVCQVMVFDNLTGEKKISKSKFKYSVDLDLASEMAGIIDEEEQESILTNILNRLLTLENPVEPYATQKHVDECVSTLTEEIDTIKVKDVEQDDKLTSIETKDVEQDGRLVNIESKNTEQDNRLAGVEAKNIEQDNRLITIEAKDVEQDGRLNLLENRVDDIDEKIVDTIEPSLDNYGNKLDALETKDIEHEQRMTNIETKNTEQDNRLNTLESKDLVHESRMTDIETKNTEQDERLTVTETKNTEQDNRLDITENRLANIGNDITNTMQPIIDEHASRLEAIEAIDVAQNTRLYAIEVKNQQQDDKLLDIEKVNKKQDIDIKCLYGASQTIDITEEGNSIYLQNSNNGFAIVDEIKGNTLVNCNKEPNKELILNGNINTSGDNTVTLTEGVDGGLVDVALEGNTLVNVSKTKDSTAITKLYTVENSGNHIALQGDADGSCRPVITGNTLWVDNATGEVLTAFDETKNLRLQSSFEDNLVTQEMVDSGEEVTDNLGKYRVDYKVTGKNKFDKSKALDGHEIADIQTGAIRENAKWFVTDFIPVIPNTSYKISGKANGNVVLCYDKSKQLISNIVSGGTTRITIPNNVRYIKLNGLLTQKDTFQIEEGGTATAYEPYKEEYTKTLYLNSPLLEGDTIEEKDGNIYHVHRSELVAYTEGDETSLITDKVNTLHQLETPTYELVEQSNLVIPSYANGHLDFNTAVPVGKVEFKPFNEELTYLYANTQYTLQFVSDVETTVNISLGGTPLLAQSIVVGLNRIGITTPSELVNNKLVISGVGANISEVVVTDTNREFGYFEGIKSVGECEGNEIEILTYNSMSLISTAPEKWEIQSNDTRNLEYVDYIPCELGDEYSLLHENVQWIAIREFDENYTFLEKTQNKQHSFTFSITNPNTKFFKVYIDLNTDFNRPHYIKLRLFKGTKDYGYSYVDELKQNTQQLTHEPLRAVGNVKDRYVMIDGKWYIERNCRKVVCDGNEDWGYASPVFKLSVANYPHKIEGDQMGWGNCDRYPEIRGLIGSGDYAFKMQMQYIQIRNKDFTDANSFKSYLNSNPVTVVYVLQTPQYEPIDYNPFEVYSDTTHITTNSVIPTNITVKNHGYNCLLKPSTTYTISSNLGLNTVTTPSTLTEDCLRFMDTDTSDVTTMRDVLVLEGDWTSKADLIPSNFSGIESAFEQELVTDEADPNYGKYKVNAKVVGKNKFDGQWQRNEGVYGVYYYGNGTYTISIQEKDLSLLDNNYTLGYSNLDGRNITWMYSGGNVQEHNKTITNGRLVFRIPTKEGLELLKRAFNIQIEKGDTATEYEAYKENNITFYINEPLRGIGDVKDRIYIKDEKVVVERNCGSRPYEDGDFGTYPTDKVNTVYPLAEPTYEEVEYNDTKLFIESFKNSTLSYNSNVPVTSTVHYSYSVPLVDTVAQTASISDEQDNMIIDLATQCAVMEMYLM